MRNDIAHSVGRPSKIVLPVLPAADSPDVPAEAPPCPSLRNEPCRDYLPARVATDVALAQNGDDRFDVTWTAPERGGTPDHYVVDVTTTGDDAALSQLAALTAPIEIDGDTTTASFVAEPGNTYVATVQAVYDDGAAPASNASLGATLQTEEPTTTSTAAPIDDDGGGDEVATDAAGSEASALPLTGAQIFTLAVIGLAILLAGAGAVMLSRRARERRAGGS